MIPELIEELKKSIKGDVATDAATLAEYSHDASLFEVKPQVVVFPKDVNDIKALIRFVSRYKKDYPTLSLTGRSAGTDMSGGSVNDSIIVEFPRFFNHIKSIKGNLSTVEPGVFYRDFEEETLKHHLIFPAYPASREICAIGGIVNNNSGGEKSLAYGKTENYIESLKMVLSDGNEYVFRALDGEALKDKLSAKTFEGEIYRKMYDVITRNNALLERAKPRVSKNSAGYYLWNILDGKRKIFDLTQLFVGAQGTLGLLTEATLRLVPTKKFSEMVIIFMKDLSLLGEIINDVLPLKPESFESYDDHTLKLAIKYFYDFAKQLGTKNVIATAWNFLPEFLLILSGGIPKLILQVEFADNERHIINQKIERLHKELEKHDVKIKIAPNKQAEKKYWLMRRESFNLLRNKIKDLHTAPFIDDFIVRPEFLPEFLPKLAKIFEKYKGLIYTTAGHMGDGNFHIIPLMRIEDKKTHEIISKLSEEVYDLVLAYHGSITAEHNDGLIRTPYLKKMYGEEIIKLFEETKKIFDPQNIFNPRKKVGGDLDFAMNHLRRHW